MSVVAVLRSVSPDEFDRGLANPASFERLLDYSDDPDSSGDFCDLEKTQDAIHFLLTGNTSYTESPFSYAIYGRRETGFILPAGPVSYLSPADVREVAVELSRIPGEELARRFSPKRLSEANVYPGIWYDDPDILVTLLDDYASLSAFYASAAATGNAVLIHIG